MVSHNLGRNRIYKASDEIDSLHRKTMLIARIRRITTMRLVLELHLGLDTPKHHIIGPKT